MKVEFRAFLDINDRHPELLGDAILPRDDDGIGFSLGQLRPLIGKEVLIVITDLETERKGYWGTEGAK